MYQVKTDWVQLYGVCMDDGSSPPTTTVCGITFLLLDFTKVFMALINCNFSSANWKLDFLQIKAQPEENTVGLMEIVFDLIVLI